MHEKFIEHLHASLRLIGDEPILTAISGGVDSMVMAHLFRLADWPHGIAHCNFRLRGAESDADEALVRAYAQEHGIPFFSIAFDTAAIAAEAKESIQITARRLRYQWLEQVRIANGYDFIATAHHQDDAAETLLYNLAKGCGIRGLHGIAERSGYLLRPLLFAGRQELEAFARQEGIAWREDASNQESYYARNKIRREAVPVFRSINPQWTQTMAANIQRFRDTEALFGFAVAQIMKQAVTTTPDGSLRIRLETLTEYPAPTTVLYEILRPYGFGASQAQAILESRERQSGALFLAGRHRLILHRGEAIVEALPANEITALEWSEAMPMISLPEGNLFLEKKLGQPEQWPASPDTALLDAERTLMPLRIRPWQPGDRFCPLGMEGRSKKLQDLFTDLQLSRFEKERVRVVETAEGEICWIAGYRADDRFKITPDTKSYYVLRFEKNGGTL